MDGVPVKISEKYKPPPRVYQLPQSIANKLQLPLNHYHDPQFSYDFQLERKVLAKVPEWQRMRQQGRDSRRDRKKKREQQRLREVEAQHKQLLGAVSYPNAEELSSTSDEESESEQKPEVATCSEAANREAEKTAISTQTSSFHNILQPTILPRSGRGVEGDAGSLVANTTAASSWSNVGYALAKEAAGKITNTAFNYKDFEEDTSSPFDNIELKTINDLDILAQVLHNTQLEERVQQAKEKEAEVQTVANVAGGDETTATNSVQSAVAQLEHKEEENEEGFAASDNSAIFADTKAALSKVDFHDLSQKLQNEDIPSAVTTITSTNNYDMSPPMYNRPSLHQQHGVYMAYNPHLYSNGVTEQHSTYASYQIPLQPSAVSAAAAAYNNQNYLYTTSAVRNDGSAAAYYNPTHAYVAHNANYLTPYSQPPNLQQQQQPEACEADLKLKSKSVPDILKELSDEVRNSEMRRSRNYSYNMDDGLHEKTEQKGASDIALQQALPVTVDSAPQYYAQLEVAAQRLAKNISSMGFPLERVSKLAKMYGADDKKIFEHLIPLSELMDLGFDETKISEALIKCDNNKEKALEFLIS